MNADESRTTPGSVEALQELLADIAGRPLTAEEIARTHQHVADVHAMFDAADREDGANAR